MNTKVLAIIAVVIVVVAGCAVFFVTRDNGSKDTVNVDASLTIMGNANNDAKIDSSDLNVIQDIIDGKITNWSTEYPLADANNDKKVTADDKTLVQNMIDHKTGIKVNVVCESGSGSSKVEYIQEVTYPLTKTVVVGTNLVTTTLLIGAQDHVAGVNNATTYSVTHAPYKDKDLKGSTTDLKDSALTNFQNLDAKLVADTGSGIDAVITMPSASYLKTAEKTITGAGIPILRLDSSDGTDAIAGALTMGFLFGADSEKTSYSYAKESFEILEYVASKTKTLATADIKSMFGVTMGTYVAQDKSPYTGLGHLAGATDVVSTYKNSSGNNPYDGDSSVKIASGDEDYLNLKPNTIVSFRSMDYVLDNGASWEKYLSTWKNHSCYENMIYLNNSMPVALRVAYLAEYLYPTLFASDYADNLNQHFVDTYMDYLNKNASDGDFDVTKDMTTVYTYSDYKNKA